jgi:hypothetical protein
MDRRHFASLAIFGAALASGSGGPAEAAKPPTEWDGLQRVKSKRLDLVFLAPGADFRAYRRVMLDPTEIAFRKNWLRDYNSARTGLSGRVSDADVQRVITEGGKAATALFTEAFNAGGYPVVAEPAEDVLRVRTGVINLSITAPDIKTAGRSYSFAQEAGQATLVIEVRDSMTGAILGRAVDTRLAGDSTAMMRNSVTNRSDFRQLVKTWAKNSVKGMEVLKGMSPSAVPAAAPQ